MGFFVGWHYVKQGYGMLMVDAVLKRKFFSDQDKKVLLFNGYAVWLFAWLQTNVVITERQFWGLEYYTFAVPPGRRARLDSNRVFHLETVAP